MVGVIPIGAARSGGEIGSSRVGGGAWGGTNEAVAEMMGNGAAVARIL